MADSGTVDFEEFVNMMSKFRKVKTTNELDDELKEIFQVNLFNQLVSKLFEFGPGRRVGRPG